MRITDELLDKLELDVRLGKSLIAEIRKLKDVYDAAVAFLDAPQFKSNVAFDGLVAAVDALEEP